MVTALLSIVGFSWEVRCLWGQRQTKTGTEVISSAEALVRVTKGH